MEPDAVPAPDPSLFSESVERTEIMVAKKNFNTKFSCCKFVLLKHIFTEDFGTDPHPDPNQYRMSRIRNTA